jgi:O-antigen/teichoic acid export membrane protein
VVASVQRRGGDALDLRPVLARSVTLNVLGQVATLLLGLIGSVALARWLGPADRGLLGVMISAVELGMAVGALGLPFAVMYYASRVDPPARELLGNSLAYSLVLAVAAVAGAWLLQEPLSDLLGHGRGGDTWVLVGVLLPITFLDWTTHNQLLGQLRFGLYNVLVVLSKVASLAVIVVLVGVLDLGVAGGLLATGAASLALTLGALPVILRAGAPRLDLTLLRRMLRYGRRVQFGSIFQIANARLDVLVLQFFQPLSQVGYYVVAQTIAELVLVLGRSFQSSVLPLVARYEGEERQALTTASSLRHHGILACAATLANAVAGSLLILFAYGPSFHPALLPMFILLPGMWFLSTGAVVAGDLGGRGRPGLSSALAGGTVVVTVALDLALIPALGVPGAAIASLVAYTCFGTASLVALARVSGIPLRELTRPTRADLTLYRDAVVRALTRLRRGGAAPR